MLQIKVGGEFIVVPPEDFVSFLTILSKAKLPNYNNWKNLSFEVSEVPDYFLQDKVAKISLPNATPPLHTANDEIPF